MFIWAENFKRKKKIFKEKNANFIGLPWVSNWINALNSMIDGIKHLKRRGGGGRREGGGKGGGGEGKGKERGWWGNAEEGEEEEGKGER